MKHLGLILVFPMSICLYCTVPSGNYTWVIVIIQYDILESGGIRDVVISKLANPFRNIEISLFFLISISFQRAGVCWVIIHVNLTKPMTEDRSGPPQIRNIWSTGHLVGYHVVFLTYLGLARFHDFKAYFIFHFKQPNFSNFEILKFHFDFPRRNIWCKLSKQRGRKGVLWRFGKIFLPLTSIQFVFSPLHTAFVYTVLTDTILSDSRLTDTLWLTLFRFQRKL